MANGHGGARPNSGPKKRRATTERTQHPDVLSYLRAVALGTEPGDALRVAAAKACLPYEEPRRRPTAKSMAPTQLRAVTEQRQAADADQAWDAVVASVKARLRAEKEPR